VAAQAFREVYLAVDREAMLWSAPIPGAVQALAALSRAGLPLAVVSNADGRIADALSRAGLDGWFDVIVDSGVVGVEKPDPRIFDHALGRLGVDPSAAWYVGDSTAYDAPAAEQAGLMPWIVDHTGTRPPSHPRTVTGFRALLDAAGA
jgi:putative hydrolase of the HAD superfamily